MSDPPGRDRFMDLIRVGSLVIVVAGHWLAIVPSVGDGVVRGTMLYDAVPAFWPLTWIFQVIPLFFFVAGFANLGSWRRHQGPHRTARFMVRRLRRLMIPTGIFLAVWVLIEVVMGAIGVGGDGFLRGMQIGQMTPFAPLWFIGVYLALALAAPLAIRLHERFGWLVPVALLAAIGAADVLAALFGLPLLELVNLFLVYALPFQLGFFYADGTLQRLSSIQLVLAGTVALCLQVVLTALPAYGRNLYDNGNSVLGTSAPTLPFAIGGLTVLAFVLAMRQALTTRLRSDGLWLVVAAANSVVMTVFLWHMTAYFASIAILVRAGLPVPARPDPTWWLQRPLFLVLPAVLLVPLVWIFAGAERAGAARDAPTVWIDSRPHKIDT